MNYLTQSEMDQVGRLKEMGILLPFTKEEVSGLTRNGGCGVFCGDGDIDAPDYHQETITDRNHSIEVFGGPLLFAPSFKGRDTGLSEGLLRNMTWGMGAKRTGSIFLYPHWPCAVGKKFEYEMLDVVNMMFEVVPIFKRIANNVYLFFHVRKKFDDERWEQNTYKLILPRNLSRIEL